jgi:hypothetical protein
VSQCGVAGDGPAAAAFRVARMAARDHNLGGPRDRSRHGRQGRD